jgi:putative tricarboxylic transport membrane protein
MRFNDALIGAALLLLALAVYLYARTLPPIPGQQYGAAVFPSLIAAGLGGCGIALVASGLRKWQGAMVPAAWTSSRPAWLRLGATFALLVFYILASNRLGFVPVSAIILFALFAMLGVRWWLAAILALAVTVVIARAFGSLLLVPLPRGLFWI